MASSLLGGLQARAGAEILGEMRECAHHRVWGKPAKGAKRSELHGVTEIFEHEQIGRRVLVTGMAGSGKSTFSRSLAAKTGLPVIHLDLHFWKPGWVAPSQLEWREKQSGLLAGDAWIADGNYHETLDLRLERADTVVFLDTPWWVCAGRAFLRGLRKPVGEMPEGCDDSSWRRLRDEWRLAIVIWRNRRSEPEREHEIISQYGQHAVLHALGSKRAAKEFLDGLDVEYTEADDG